MNPCTGPPGTLRWRRGSRLISSCSREDVSKATYRYFEGKQPHPNSAHSCSMFPRRGMAQWHRGPHRCVSASFCTPAETRLEPALRHSMEGTWTEARRQRGPMRARVFSLSAVLVFCGLATPLAAQAHAHCLLWTADNPPPGGTRKPYMVRRVSHRDFTEAREGRPRPGPKGSVPGNAATSGMVGWASPLNSRYWVLSWPPPAFSSPFQPNSALGTNRPRAHPCPRCRRRRAACAKES